MRKRIYLWLSPAAAFCFRLPRRPLGERRRSDGAGAAGGGGGGGGGPRSALSRGALSRGLAQSRAVDAARWSCLRRAGRELDREGRL
eukprot:scaffold55988_cov17-Tisochrysis_lutea.AAC.1